MTDPTLIADLIRAGLDALKHEHRLITGLDGLVNRSRRLSQVFQYQ